MLPTSSATPAATFLIPEGFLSTEEIAKRPLNQAGVSWLRNDAANLPPMLAPCGTPLPSESQEAVAGRQMVLVNATHLWKAERLVVYASEAAASRAVTELRDALVRCARHPEAEGRHTEWQMQPLDIGDEAFFLGGQLYSGTTPLSFHFRGVVFRQDRAVHMLIDHGESLIAPTIEEVQPTDLSQAMADSLSAAPWAH